MRRRSHRRAGYNGRLDCVSRFHDVRRALRKRCEECNEKLTTVTYTVYRGYLTCSGIDEDRRPDPGTDRGRIKIIGCCRRYDEPSLTNG